MLTTEASNALLKTLEEPPPHVMFILATTDPQKLIATIRSRTTGVIFTRANDDEIVRSLKKVIRGEKLKIDNEAAEIIAQSSDGSFRDAQKILEQLILEKIKLTKNKVSEHLTDRGTFNVKHFIDNLVRKNTKDSLKEIEAAIAKGTSVKSLAESIVTFLRSALLVKVGMEGEDLKKLSKGDVINMLKLFSEASSKIPTSFIEQIPIEIAVVEWCDNEDPGSATNGDSESFEKEPSNSKNKGSDKGSNATSSMKAEKKQNNETSYQENINANGISESEWTRILKELRPRNSSTEALLRAAKPVGYDGKTLKLGVFYSFHKEKLEGDPHRLLLEEVVALVKGDGVRIECLLTEPPKKKVLDEKGTDSHAKDDVSGVASTGPGGGQTNKTQPDILLTESDDEDIIKVAKEIFEAD